VKYFVGVQGWDLHLCRKSDEDRGLVDSSICSLIMQSNMAGSVQSFETEQQISQMQSLHLKRYRETDRHTLLCFLLFFLQYWGLNSGPFMHLGRCRCSAT
jgi:hypothetical protein